MKRLAAVLLVVAACKGGDKDASKGGTSSNGNGKGGCETTAAKPAELVAGKTPQLLAPFGKLSLGMSREDAAKACPNFFQGEDGKKTGTFSVGEIVGKFGDSYAQARLEFVADKLQSVSFALPAEIADALTSAWGAPKASSGATPAHAWLDEASGMRAILEPADRDGRRELNVSKFTPLAAFIVPDDKTLGWRPEEILGKQPAELAKKFPQFVKVEKTSAAVQAKTDELMADMNKDLEKMGVNTKRDANMPEFELPASPLAANNTTHVILHTFDTGAVRSYGVWFRTASLTPEYGWPTQSEEIIKKLDEVYGPHKVVRETLGDRWTWFDAKRGVRASIRKEKPDRPEELDLDYAKYLPLANLFGAPGPLWGFEKAERPLIGATPDEIVATYGKDFEVKRDDKGGTLTLVLPPTDYDGDTSSTHILMFVRSGKVGQWNVHIPFEDYDPARGEYEAALDAKFGKPKKAPRDHFLYGKKPTVDVEYSKYTHELHVEVSK
jgi:hypothetical protein